MRENNIIVVRDRCKNCFQASPKAYRNEISQSLAKCLSEYQSAFKAYQWQPVRQSLKPGESNLTYEKVRAMMERRSTYGVDYIYHPAPKKVLPKKHKGEIKVPDQPMDETSTYHKDYKEKELCPVQSTKPKSSGGTAMISQDPKEKFHGDSMYKVSYPAFDDKTLADCKQNPIKKKDNMQIHSTGSSRDCTQTTAQSDFVRHKNVVRPTAMRPVENTVRPTDPLQERTEYKDFYTTKTPDFYRCKKNIIGKSNNCQFRDVTTAMADFTTPKYTEQPKSCRPESTYHQSPDKFEGETTFSTAYKAWPVTQYELPIWAKKPIYKRPAGGMIVNTLYMHDFRNPKVICPPAPIVPSKVTKNVIQQDCGDRGFENATTYSKEFKVWTEATAPQSFRTNEEYKPPTEKMAFETNQRSHFKGAQAERMKLCRHSSQHRSLNTELGMSFTTTYAENYTYPRPYSSPCVAPPPPSMTSRCASASTSHASNYQPLATSSSCQATTGSTSIPKPDLSTNHTADVLKIISDLTSTEMKVCCKCLKPDNQCQC